MKSINKTLKSLILATALCLTHNMAFAANPITDKLYFGIGLVQSELSVNKNNVNANFTNNNSRLDSNGFGLELLAGYKVDDYLAFEIGYTDIGDVSSTNNSVSQNIFSVDSLYIDAKFNHNLTANIDAFAKLGVSMWEINSDVDSTLESGEGLLYGAGFDINLYNNKDRLLRVEWEHHEFDNITLNDADTVSVSAIFQF